MGIPKGYKGLLIVLPKRTHEQFKQTAKRLRISGQDLGLLLVEEYLRLEAATHPFTVTRKGDSSQGRENESGE